MKKLLSLSLICFYSGVQAQTTSSANETKMQWFADAKLGIFIHWGIYSSKGIEASWPFFQKQVTYQEYISSKNGFTASQYKPEEWAKLFKETGAKYVVLTSKHHDGVALWDTKENNLSVPKMTPAARDVLTPLLKEIEKQGIKKGIYYSLLDWSNDNYPNFLRDKKRFDPQEHPEKLAKFAKFNQNQLTEINQLVRPDLWWFDGEWELSAEQLHTEQIGKMLRGYNANVIINGRLKEYGDYSTPENGLPIIRPDKKYWELCMTMNGTWGYNPTDKAYKSPYEIITTFAEVISDGGNLLLNVGPKPDGTLAPEQVTILKALGKWTNKHQKAIYGTKAGLPKGYFYGPSTIASDSSALYLYLIGKPTGELYVKGIQSFIDEIRVLGHDKSIVFREVPHRNTTIGSPPVVYFEVPLALQDEYVTVLAIKPKGKLKISVSKGRE